MSSERLIRSSERVIMLSERLIKSSERLRISSEQLIVFPPTYNVFATSYVDRRLNMSERIGILSLNEKLPVSKHYSRKYIMQTDGYFNVHVYDQRHTGLETKTSSTSHGTMVHVIHVQFVVFAVFENLKASFL